MLWINKKLRVLVLGGGPSVEHDVSLRTAQMIYENLARTMYEPRLATITKNGMWLIAPFLPLGEEEAVSKIKSVADVVFIALHGEYGEDGTVQRLFDKHSAKLFLWQLGILAFLWLLNLLIADQAWGYLW
ncbi:MAG TPA: hypothetical protein VJC20_04655 [Candidatus Paceibacterota bacterium]